MPDPRPLLPIALHLGPSLSPAAEVPEFRNRLLERTTARVDVLLETLAIPAVAAVELVVDGLTDPLQVYVRHRPAPPPGPVARVLYQVYADHVADATRPVDPDKDWTRWVMAHVRPEPSREPISPSRVSIAAEFLARIVVQTITLSPGRLLGSEHTGTYAAFAGGGWDPERTGAILRTVLDQYLPLPDPVAAGYWIAGRDAGAVRITEELIAAARSGSVLLELQESLAASLLGLEMLEPVPVEALDPAYELAGYLMGLKQQVLEERGVYVPAIHVVPASLPRGAFRVKIGALATLPRRVPGKDRCLAEARTPDLPSDVEAWPFPEELWVGSPLSVIPEAEAGPVEEAGIAVRTPAWYVAAGVHADLRRHAHRLLDVNTTDNMLAGLSIGFPALVESVLQAVPAERITGVLRTLLRDGLSIRNLRGILEALLAYEFVSAPAPTVVVDHHRLVIDERLDPFSEERAVEYLSSFVRKRLRRQVSHELSGGTAVIPVFLLDAASEENILLGLAAQDGAPNAEPITPAQLEHIRTTIRNSVGADRVGGRAAILTTSQVAAVLRREAHDEIAPISFVSYDELAPDVSIQPVDRISWM
jgi:type III secretion system FlhB-like substrate exporter